MSLLKNKINISEEKIKTKKTISLLSKTISGDWKILIGLILLSLVLGSFFSWNTYRSIANQSFLKDKGEIKKSGLKINTEQLDRVVNNFNERKEKFNNLTGQN